MENFEREIARRSAAAAATYDRKLYGQNRRRQQARKALAEVRRQFVRAALYAESRLRVQYLEAPESDRAVGYALVWAECPPRRELCIRLDEASSELRWELASPELRPSRAGRVGVPDFQPEFLDQLIYALLEQETWRRSRVPSVEPALSHARGYPAGRQGYRWSPAARPGTIADHSESQTASTRRLR